MLETKVAENPRFRLNINTARKEPVMVNSVTSAPSSSVSGTTNANSAQAALKALLKLLESSQSTSGSTTSSQTSTDTAQSLFNQIDTTGKGTINKTDLEAAVTKAGGTKQAADALWAKLDPNKTGSLTEQQFAQSLSSLQQGAKANGSSDNSTVNITINISAGTQDASNNSANRLNVLA